MTRRGRFQMAALFAALSPIYIYGALTEHGAWNLFGQLWGAVGFLGLATFQLVKAINTK